MFEDKAVIKELTNIVGQLQISDSQIIFRGKRYDVTSENATAGLSNILYSECYALKESYQAGLAIRQNHLIEDNVNFVNLLSQNNHTKDKIEQGWTVKNSYPNGYAEVVKQSESRIVPTTAIKESSDGAITNGQTVTVFFPKEDRNRQPTFYYIFSNQTMNISQKLTRIYWNCTSEGAPVLIDAITKKLNHYNIPFLFKCLNNPDLYFRRDPAVLYVEDTMMHLLGLILPEIYEVMKDFLEEDVPLFAYKYQNGIGIAESPNAQESFGMNRMAILAGSLLQEIPKKLTTEATINGIATAFLQKGINPSATFLNKGSRKLFN